MKRFSSSSSSSSSEFTYTTVDDDLISICSYCDSSSLSSSSSDSVDNNVVEFDPRPSAQALDVSKLTPKLEIIDPHEITYGFRNGLDIAYKPITCHKCDSKMNTEQFNKTGNKKYNYVKCGICKHTFCKKHVKLCDNCQSWYCQNCVKHWYDLTINSIKRYYCVYCEQTYRAQKKLHSKCVLI